MDSAQRLTASMVFSRSPIAITANRSVVLNASRHLWYFHNQRQYGVSAVGVCSTPHGINGIFTLPIAIGRHYGLLCSTPHGINGIFTVLNKFKRIGWFVLNASRHQWYFHLPHLPEIHPQSPCSTPHGINGIFTYPQM